MSAIPESKLARYREILANRPKRESGLDLSWELDELAAARPSIIRAMELEDDMIFNAHQEPDDAPGSVVS